MKIDKLRKQFLADFGIKQDDARIHTKTTPPVTIGDTEWVFGMRKIERSSDTTWVSLNVDFSMGTDVGTEVVNDSEMNKALMALAVCSINEVPTFKMVGVEIPDNQIENVVDFNNPPSAVKFAAAALFKTMLSTMEEGPAVIRFLKTQYDEMFPARLSFGHNPDAPKDHKFYCPDCHYITVVKPEDMGRLEATIKENEGLSCLCCGTISNEKNEEKETGPLDRPGRES